MENQGWLKRTLQLITGDPLQPVNKTEKDEFLLCLHAFLPCWQGFKVNQDDNYVSMEDAINKTKYILHSLHEMSFTANSNYRMQRFIRFSTEDCFKVYSYWRLLHAFCFFFSCMCY